MNLKSIGKRLLSVALALVMAVPFIVFTPPVTVEAVPDLTAFAAGRHTITVNGLTATVTAWDNNSGEMTVSFTGAAATLSNARYLVYARAGTGANTTNYNSGAFMQTVDAGPITNIVYFNATPAPVTLSFGAGPHSNVRLYIGIVTTGGNSGAGGFMSASAAPGSSAARNNAITINGITVNATHNISGAGASTLGYTLAGTANARGTYRVWFAQDSAAWGGTPPTIPVPSVVGQVDPNVGPWGTVAQDVHQFTIGVGDAAPALMASWTLAPSIPARTVLRAEFAPLPPLDTIATPESFFYAINYGRETISFGNDFTVWDTPVLNDLGRPTVDIYARPILAPRDTSLTGVNRANISVVFNRRADRIRLDRGRWTQPGAITAAEFNIANRLRRGGYLGVRWQNPATGMFEFLTVIQLDPRPNHRPLRVHRREIYLPPRMVGDNIEANNFVQNPLTAGGHTLEVRIGGVRGGAFNAQRNVYLPASRLAPGDTIPLAHDTMSRNTRGFFRVAPQEAVNFAWDAPDGTQMHIRDLARTQSNGFVPSETGTGWVEFNLQPALEAGGRFGSLVVNFRIPNQGLAPAVARMLMTPGANGNPWFISNTNANTWVKVAYDAQGQPIWRRFQQSRVQLQQLNQLFIGTGTAANPEFPLPAPRRINIAAVGTTPASYHYVHDFELRLIRPNRVISMPGTLSLRTDEFASRQSVTARITQGVVVGVGVPGVMVTPTGASLSTTPLELIITTQGGRTTGLTANVTTGTDVTDWFDNMPAGLTARVTRLTNQNTAVTVRITGEILYAGALVNVPMEITIPAAHLEDFDTPITVTNPITGTPPNAMARFHLPR